MPTVSTLKLLPTIGIPTARRQDTHRIPVPRILRPVKNPVWPFGRIPRKKSKDWAAAAKYSVHWQHGG